MKNSASNLQHHASPKKVYAHSDKTNETLAVLLDPPSGREEYSALLTAEEKKAYFADFDTIPGVSTKAEELADELSALPWKKVPPAILGNNFVVGFPGMDDAQKKAYMLHLAHIFGHDTFVAACEALPHFRNVFLFTLPENGGNIPEHFHHQEARLFVLDGSAQDIAGNLVQAGAIIINKPLERHAYHTVRWQKVLAISRWADDGILDFDTTTGEFLGIHDFEH